MSRADLLLWWEALKLRATVPLLLWALPLDRVLHILTPSLRPSPPPVPARPFVLRAVESVSDAVTRRRPVRTACLKRALLRYALLRRGGYPAGFVVGVRRGSTQGFEAHAWVTLDDGPIMERAPVDYRPTFVWPPQRLASALAR